MSSRDLPRQSIDYIISTALHEQVDKAEPSPEVWKRIRRRALKRVILNPSHTAWNRNALFMPVPAWQSSSLAPRSELLLLRFWEYAGILLRFGW